MYVISSIIDQELMPFQSGQHDIENEMVFRSNPGFIFHDSCGFEAGGISELKKVTDFVTQCSKARNLHDQLHAIW